MNASRPPIEGGPTFSRAQRLHRAIWITTWLFLCSWTPPFLYKWRRLILVIFGANLHPTARVYSSAKIWLPANLTMEENSCIGPKSNIYTMAPIKLGAHSLVSQGAFLCTGSHNIDQKSFPLVTKPIEIGCHAWVAAEAFVGPGVKIGSGAVLGARSCAFHHLEPWTVYVGNPAIKRRTRCRAQGLRNED